MNADEKRPSIRRTHTSAASRLEPEQVEYIDQLLAQGYGVTILRSRTGRLLSAWVTEDGKFNESWCN